MGCKVVEKSILSLGLLVVFGSCGVGEENELAAREEISPSVQKEEVESEKSVEEKCTYKDFSIYPLFPNALQRKVVFTTFELDIEEWLNKFHDNEITDYERRYVELVKKYKLSSMAFYRKEDRFIYKDKRGAFEELSYHQDFYNFMMDHWHEIHDSLNKKHKNKKFDEYSTREYLLESFVESPANALLLLSVNVSILEGSYRSFEKAVQAIKRKEIEEIERIKNSFASKGVPKGYDCPACKGFDLDEHYRGLIIKWSPEIWQISNIINDKINKNKHDFYYENIGINSKFVSTSATFNTRIDAIFGDDNHLDTARLLQHGICGNYDVRAVWDYVLYKDRDRSDFSNQDIKNYEISKQIYLNATIEGE